MVDWKRLSKIFRVVVFVFCLWQLEICLIFRAVGWETDILFVKFPNWFVVTFYSMVLLAIYIWSEYKKS